MLKIAIGLGLVVFFVHPALPTSLAGGDTLWSVPTSYSVVHHYSVVTVCIVSSVFTNLRAATHQSVQTWNATPNVDKHGDRNWDWSDPQFLR